MVFCIVAGANGAQRNHLDWSRCPATAPGTHIGNLWSILASIVDCGNSRLVELPISQIPIALVLGHLINTTELDNVPGVLVEWKCPALGNSDL